MKIDFLLVAILFLCEIGGSVEKIETKNMKPSWVDPEILRDGAINRANNISDGSECECDTPQSTYDGTVKLCVDYTNGCNCIYIEVNFNGKKSSLNERFNKTFVTAVIYYANNHLSIKKFPGSTSDDIVNFVHHQCEYYNSTYVALMFKSIIGMICNYVVKCYNYKNPDKTTEANSPKTSVPITSASQTTTQAASGFTTLTERTTHISTTVTQLQTTVFTTQHGIDETTDAKSANIIPGCKDETAVYDEEARNCVCRPTFTGNPEIACIATCEGKIELENMYTFPVTKVNSFGFSIEKCSNGRSLAKIKCVWDQKSSSAIFKKSSAHVLSCETNIISIVENLTKENIGLKMKNLHVISSHESELKGAITETVEFLTKSANIIKSEKSEENDIVINDALSIMSSVCGIIKNLGENYVSKKVFSSIIPQFSESLSSDTDFTSDLLNVQSTEVTTKSSFSPVVTTNGGQSIPIDIVIPSEAINITRSNGLNPRLAFVLDSSGCLNPTNESIDLIVSGVISNQTIEDLNDPVVISFFDKEPGSRTINERNSREVLIYEHKCVFWDDEESVWSDKGCKTITNGTTVQCVCNHLTNFALLFTRVTRPADVTLEVVSLVGCISSIVCLFMTIFIYSTNRKLNKKRPSIILINICFNLLVFDIIFVSGINKNDLETICLIVAMLLHYFMLTTWLWMTVYAYDVYLALVKVFTLQQSRFLRKSALICYIIPVVIVSLSAGLTHSGNKDSLFQYKASYMCWVNGHAFYFGFALPIGILLICNTIFYSLVMKNLFCVAKQVVSTKAHLSILNQFYIACTFAMTTGITWILGYLMLLSENDLYLNITSWLFAIFNSLQGFLIFMFTCARNEVVRQSYLIPLWLTITCRKRKSTPSPSIRYTSKSTVSTTLPRK